MPSNNNGIVRESRGLLLICLVFLSAAACSAENPNDGCLACDREMRRTLEAIQAWRRLHHGVYPPRLVELKSAGLLPFNGAICPDVLREMSGAKAAHAEVSSRGEGGDPPGTYEYEMSSSVIKSDNDAPYLPAGTPEYTRQQFKSVLLRRPFFDQVPILRCTSHKTMAPPNFSRDDEVFRNATVTGSVYWSALPWEQNWLDDVPYCAREANIMFGLKGPPFYTDLAPSIPQALDLRQWSCAFGDHPWWWTYPLFHRRPDWQSAADLRPFFHADHGRVLSLGGEQWWIDGLVQLQGRVIRGQEEPPSAPGALAFVWRKTGAKVGRKILGASSLQATVWNAPTGEAAGWLVWHYLDGTSRKTPIVYGKNTARFWGDAEQIQSEHNFIAPVWTYHEDKAEAGCDRWLRLYKQDWTNPAPEIVVSSLDFVSNSNSPAAPFIVAITTR
jgi:hypothetical protein